MLKFYLNVEIYEKGANVHYVNNISRLFLLDKPSHPPVFSSSNQRSETNESISIAGILYTMLFYITQK